MTKLYETKELEEKVILVGVNTGNISDMEESLEELEELVKTAGAITVGKVIQNLDRVNTATYVGSGKVEEILNLVEELEATGIVCDDELSPVQMKNLQVALGTKVMDRTLIILEIFAQRANTKEGKIQVELAQLQYRSSRLIGLGNSLSRLGGGIGTKGPGEKKLEMDRRLIRERITQLSKELEDIKKNRDVQRQLRKNKQVPVVCIAGYTNAGKSTLLNSLTDAGVLEENKLFATLDPTTRNLTLPKGQNILITDTVGFIRKLPHHLIKAFRSTLEEAKYSDMILHVVDCSNSQMDKQMQSVYETFQHLDVGQKPIITIFNKIDCLEMIPILKDEKADYTVNISAKTKQGIEECLNIIEAELTKKHCYIEEIYSYEKANIVQYIRKYGQLLEEDYQETGLYVRGYIPRDMYHLVKND